MDLLFYLLLLAVSGLFVGAFGRLVIPGPDPMGLLGTIGVGLAGSFAAGLVMWLITGGTSGAGLLLSIGFAALFVYGIRRSRGGTLTDSGMRPLRR